MAYDDVLIVGKLKDDELRKSINELVDYVDRNTATMASSFVVSIDMMKGAMKDFAITQKVSVNLMKQAWREMSTSFDAMVAAQNIATSASTGSATGGSGSSRAAYQDGTLGALKAENAEIEKGLNYEKLNSAELQKQVDLLEKQKNLVKQQTTSTPTSRLETGLQLSNKSLEEAQRKLRFLETIQRRYANSTELSVEQQKKLANAIDKCKRSIDKFNSAKPKTLKDVLGMDENSVDAIAKKMAALKKVTIDSKNSSQVKQLGDEYQRLSRLQADLLGKSVQLTHSNNYLAQSFGYIRNRVVYALTLGAATNFVKELYEVRAQYELLERSIGVLIGSFERGSQIFQELNTMALKSPFTLMELGTAAKQLTAYNFTANEVVNTTRRLADISAALGVPMERLTYNLGQIRAQTVLTARDARDFANAGLPIVKSLSDYYSELEGKVVSTGDVYDRMSKKMVSYNDVMTVLNQLTDEGGKFFDFQAKQAETLRVQMANLSLAWNNMLNDIGKDNQGFLSTPIKSVKVLLENWKELSHVITEVVAAYGIYKVMNIAITRVIGENIVALKRSILAEKEKIATELKRKALTEALTDSEKKLLATRKLVTAADYQAALTGRNLTKMQAQLMVLFNRHNVELQKALIRMNLLTAAEIKNITVGKALRLVFESLKISLKSLASSFGKFFMSNWWMILIAGGLEFLHTWSEVSEQVQELNKSIVDSAKESSESISKFLKDYKETYKALYEWEKKNDGTVSIKKDKKGNLVTKNINEEEAKKAWEAIRGEIELSSSASNIFIERLMKINDVNDRVRAGFDYLQKIHDVNGALETLDKEAVDVAGDYSKWWNLWSLPDGLIGNLKDYQAELDRVIEKYGSLAKAKETAESSSRNAEAASAAVDTVKSSYETFAEDLRETTESMYNAFTSVGVNSAEGMREAFEKSNANILQKANMSSKEQLQYKMKAEEDFINYRKSLFDEEYAYELKQGNTKRAEQVKEEEYAWVQQFGVGKSISQAFYSWLKNQHASEINKMFGNMTNKEIDHLNWSDQKWQKWATENAESFSNQYGIAFDKLRGLVRDANSWKIFLKLTISTDEKSVYDTLKDADAAADAAWSKIQRLKKRQAELNAIAYSQQTDSQKDESKRLVKELTDAQDDYNNALEKGGHANKKEKSEAKNRKQAESELQKVLKDELQLIDKVRNQYKKLTDAGVDNVTALTIVTNQFEDSINHINKVLGQHSIPKFDISLFSGTDNPNALLEMLKKQLEAAKRIKSIKPSEIKDLEVKYSEIVVDAKVYNTKKITDGLNRELGKIKEEYELAVELDANPELGSMLLDMFGIDSSGLTSSIEEYMFKVQNAFEKVRRDLGYSVSLDVFKANADEWDAWGKYVGMSEEKVKSLRQAFDGLVDVARKKMADVVKETKNLEYKLGDLNKKIQIEKDKKNVFEQLAKDASDPKIKKYYELLAQDQQLAIDKLEQEAIQLLPFYEDLFGDLYNVSTKRLKQIAKTAKEVMTLRQGGQGIGYEMRTNEKGKPVYDIYAKDKNDEIKKTTVSLEEFIKISKQLDSIQQKVGESNPWEKIKDSFSKANKEGKKGLKNFGSGMEVIGGELQKISEVASTVAELVSLFSNPNEYNETAEAFQDIASSFNGLSNIAGGIGKIASQDYIGGIASIASGLLTTVSAWMDNSDKKISAQVKESERAIKRLENEYKKLQQAMDDAYGVAEIGAKRAAIANKEIQLLELKRSLQLEESRGSKKRDEDKIEDLKGQIIDLELEIKNATREIVSDLTGITSVGDAAESMVSQMIEAFKQGEDYMGKFSDTFDDMVDNMIMKAIVSKVVGEKMQEIFNRIQEIATKRADQTMVNVKDIFDDTGTQWVRGWINDGMYFSSNDQTIEQWRKGIEQIMSRNMTEEGKKVYSDALEKLNKLYSDNVTITPSDVSSVKQEATEMKDDAKKTFDAYMEAFGILFGQDSTKELSALQQGIQGITEDTAGALEAYMNGVSQQVYLHSQLLTEIRDAIVGFNFDVQVGTMAEMLLQLQQSYQVQMSIESILRGVLNPSEQAIKVELLS